MRLPNFKNSILNKTFRQTEKQNIVSFLFYAEFPGLELLEYRHESLLSNNFTFLEKYLVKF